MIKQTTELTEIQKLEIQARSDDPLEAQEAKDALAVIRAIWGKDAK